MKAVAEKKEGLNGRKEAKGDARERLLDSAERLFALHGYNGISIRSITEDAQVNIAAAHYHFGSKEDLFKAIFERRIGPLKAERHKRLDAVEAAAKGGKVDAAAVIDAFISPSLEHAADPSTRMFSLLAGRASTDPSQEVRGVLFAAHHDVSKRFVDLLQRSYPELTREELFYRLACIYGALTYVTSNNGRLQALMGDDVEMDSRKAIDQVTPFLIAGFNRPKS